MKNHIQNGICDNKLVGSIAVLHLLKAERNLLVPQVFA
jgi:hypothetical protein